MYFTSVTVTQAAQNAYLEKNPDKGVQQPQAATSSGASTSKAPVSAPLQDAATQKMRRKANEAVVASAASNSTLKKLKKSKA